MTKQSGSSYRQAALDPDFESDVDVDGYVTQLLVLPDRSIIMSLDGGRVPTRYCKTDPEGKIDTSFGTNGYLTLPFPSGVSPFLTAGLHSLPGTGKVLIRLLVRVRSDENTSMDPVTMPATARLFEDGRLDQDYGKDGVQFYVLPFEEEKERSDVSDSLKNQKKPHAQTEVKNALLGDLGLTSEQLKSAKDGNCQRSAHDDGIQNTSDWGGFIHLPEGGCFLATEIYQSGTDFLNYKLHGYLIKLTESGELDKSFNNVGYLQLEPGKKFYPTGLYLTPGGDSFIVSGAVRSPTELRGSESFVMKIDSSGNLDSQFADHGYFKISTEVGYFPCQRMIPADENLIIVGNVAGGIFLASLNQEGQIPKSFNGGKIKIIYPLTGPNLPISDAFLDSNGKIVVCGRFQTPLGEPNDGLIGRFDAQTGEPDAGFGDENGLARVEGAQWCDAGALQGSKYLFGTVRSAGGSTLERVLGDSQI